MHFAERVKREIASRTWRAAGWGVNRQAARTASPSVKDGNKEFAVPLLLSKKGITRRAARNSSRETQGNADAEGRSRRKTGCCLGSKDGALEMLGKSSTTLDAAANRRPAIVYEYVGKICIQRCNAGSPLRGRIFRRSLFLWGQGSLPITSIASIGILPQR